MDSETMELAALGRPFSLGMLYDCRKDSLVPGMTLWDRNDLIRQIGERPQNYNDFEIVASESIEDKSSALNVDASLKASFLSGLIQVGGSAKYLSDSKTSKNLARVTLKYKATTKIQELSMDHLGTGNMKHPYIFEKQLATHVVTAILYGAQAFFVFDREVSEKEDHQNIEGNLKLMIKKIPSLAIEGKGDLKMENQDRAKTENFSCRFFGDFSLQKTPTSFEDAIQVYQSLPRLLGPKGENAVPMKVWLLPLTTLNSAAAKIVCQISIRLVQESQSVLEDFGELEMRCNDNLKTLAAQQFPQITRKIKAFKELCSEFKLDFQQALAKKLPSIRGGGEEESVLAEILRNRHSSPFNSKDLHEWMDSKEREIYTLMYFTKMMKNTKVVPSQNHLFKEILSAEHAICFVFTSLGSSEPYLSSLSNYLKQTSKPDIPGDVEQEQWYVSKGVADSTRQRAKLFIDFAEANKENDNIRFFAVGLASKAQKGSSIFYYKDGFIVSENFELPSKPETVVVNNVTHNSVTLKVSPPAFGAENLTFYFVEYRLRGEDEWQQKTIPKAEVASVTDLSPNTEYMFRCRAMTSVGVGPANQVSGPVKTLPCSPPGEPHVKANSSELSVSWVKPAEFGPDVQIWSYIVEYAKTDNAATHQWNSITSSTESVLISGLQPETEYVVRVICDCGVTGRSKESISVHVITTKLQRLKATGERIDAGSPAVSNLLLKEEDMDVDGCRRYSFGEESTKPNRTIILFGETGCGKSTLINGMINYIAGVEWKDRFRFRLTVEDQSRSSEVNVYKINHQESFKIDHSLTIVDTPGFGDVKGVKRGEEIIKHLHSLFSAEQGVHEIHAVCFIAQAPSARITTTQGYVFDSVLSIFGQDMVENIRVLVTFADLQCPPVLEAIKASGVPCLRAEDGTPLHFTFNSSALFADNTSDSMADEDGDFGQMFWNMGTESMERFFAALKIMTSKSLEITREVLREREEFENGFESLLKFGYLKLQEVKRRPANPRETPAQVLTAELKATYNHRQDEVEKLMERSAEIFHRLDEIGLKPKLFSAEEYIELLVEGEKSEAKPGWKKRVQFLITCREKQHREDYEDDEDAAISLMMSMLKSYFHCIQASPSSDEEDDGDVIFLMKKILTVMLMRFNIHLIEDNDDDDSVDDDDDDENDHVQDDDDDENDHDQDDDDEEEVDEEDELELLMESMRRHKFVDDDSEDDGSYDDDDDSDDDDDDGSDSDDDDDYDGPCGSQQRHLRMSQPPQKSKIMDKLKKFLK